MLKIILKKGKGESLKRFHPWVFSGAVLKVQGEPKEGDVVEVYSHDGEFMGCGHYQIGSIAVRILSFVKRKIDAEFWEEMLGNAYRERCALGLTSSLPDYSASHTTAYRLVHGEGDNLPGLIIDIYGNVAVMQAHSAGMFRAKDDISKALQKIYGNNLVAVYDKSSGTAPFKAGLDLCDGYLYKSADFETGESVESGENVVLENGNRFLVNWLDGQKTGFFLDQRDNRELVKKYSKGKDVLNLFCYTGGFSIYALSGGAKHVDSVDSSKRAIELVRRNVLLNGFTDSQMPLENNEDAVHEAFCEDAIEYMRKCESGKYNLMVVDPPAFAKHRGALDNALRAYKKLNALAIEKVAPGGIIFTYSCSQVVDKHAFALAVFSAAAQTGRKVRILHRLTQPADHPVNIYHPEGEYLKGLVLYVE